MGDTVEFQHERRMRRLLEHQSVVMPSLQSKLAAATARGISNGVTASMRSRLHVVQSEVEDYVFSVSAPHRPAPLRFAA